VQQKIIAPLLCTLLLLLVAHSCSTCDSDQLLVDYYSNSMASASSRELILECQILNAIKKHKGTVIWMHGLGDSSEGWESDMRYLQKSAPHIKFILPTAPSVPVSLSGGMRMPAWHDVKRLDKIMDEDFEGLDRSISAIKNIIDDECKSGEISSDKVIVGGFSQGAAMSLMVGYTYPSKLGGVAVFSGYMPRYERFGQFLSEKNKNTPAYIGHGTADNVVSIKAAEKIDEILTTYGIPHEFKTFKGVQHAACEEEIDDLLDFFLKNIPDE
jgi:predicted esterase